MNIHAELNVILLTPIRVLLVSRLLKPFYKLSIPISIGLMVVLTQKYCNGSSSVRINSVFSTCCSSEFISSRRGITPDNFLSTSRRSLKQEIDTLYVGSSHSMKTLTGDNGLFVFLNQASLSKPLVVIIDSDLEETGKYTLKRWSNSPSTAHNVVTITSDNQIRIIRNDLNHYSNLITLDQTQDLIIDGKEGRTLVFSPFKTVSNERSVAILVSNYTTNCIFKNVTVLNNQKSIGYGAIHVTNSQCKLTLDNILFRPHTNSESDYYTIGIKCQNGNHQLTVKNCEFVQFSTNGIFVAGSTANQTISNSHFYRFYSGATSISCIYISEGKGHKITGNYFGGNSPYGGSAPVLLSKACYFKAIYLNNTSFSDPIFLSSNVLENVSLILPSGQPINTGYLACILLTSANKSIAFEKSADTLLNITGNICHNLTLAGATFEGVSVQNNVNNITCSIRNNNFQNVITTLDISSTVFFNCIDIITTNSSLLFIRNNDISEIEATNSSSVNSRLQVSFIKLTTASSTIQLLENHLDSVYLSCIAPTGMIVKGIEVVYNGTIDLNIAKNRITDVSRVGADSFGDLYGFYVSAVQPASSPSKIELVNNVVHLGQNSRLFSGVQKGIVLLVSASDGVNVLHNSVALEGVFSGITYSDAVLSSKTISALQVRNNLFINNGLPANGAAVIIDLLDSYPAGMSLHWSDCNNFWSTGTPLFKVGTNQYSGFLSWINSSLEPDKHSFNVDINFLDRKSLIPDSAYFLPCEPLGQVTTDFNSNIRGLAPFKSDIGAFEKKGKQIIRWLGKSNAWNDERNWDIGFIPTNNSKIQIPPWAINFPDLPSGDIVEIKTLVNYQGVPLDIHPSSGLTILGTTCPDTCLTQVTLQGTIESLASLISNSRIKIGFNKPLEGYGSLPPLQQSIHGWHLFSCPFNGYSFTSFLDNGSNADLYYWSEINSSWINYKLEGGLINPLFGENFNSGKGYLIASENDRPIYGIGLSPVRAFSYSNLTLTEGSENSGWHLLGNPFPSGIIWGTEDWSLSGVDNIAKVWSEEDASYVDVLPNQGIIPSANGFFVHVNNTINRLTIPLSARIHSHDFYKNLLGKYYIKIEATDTLLKAKQSLNLFFDDSIFISSNLKSLAMKGYAPSMFFTDENLEFSTITSHSFDTLISLVYHPINQNPVRIAINSNLPSDLSVEFIDLEDGKHLVLEDSLEVSLNPAVDLPDYRFTLKLSTQIATPKPDQIDIYSDGDSFYIKNAQDGIVELFDLAGRLIVTQNTNEDLLWKSRPTGLEGLYAVIVRSNFGTTGKILRLTTK